MYYWSHGTGPGSQQYWRTSRGPGSKWHWENATGYGSLHHWNTGKGPGSRFYWLSAKVDPNDVGLYLIAYCKGRVINIDICDALVPSPQRAIHDFHKQPCSEHDHRESLNTTDFIYEE